jgi:3-hydroxy-9,10-secoandrosta-1,3,5(10)-triene-9,17-dione monooxygenase
LLGPSGGKPRAIDSPAVQANVADAASLIDSALLQVARAADDADRIAQAGDEMDPVVRARLRVDTSQAARQIRTASSLLLDIGGASRLKSSDPIQRLWRDLETATRHPLLNTEVNRIPYGRLLLGLAPN